MSRTVFLTIFVLAFSFHQLFSQPIVTIANGDVRGSVMTSSKGRPFYAFRGIPYAQPPIHHLRFQPPVPSKNWTGVFNATENGNVCMQWNGQEVEGDEDCLFIYVYTPILPANTSQLLPVVSLLHGGGFAVGGPWHLFAGPERFLDLDVILVTIGYRLAPFGFLSTNDSSSYGNYGLLDQVLALKWIQTNIAAFGGDKSKVTLYGVSAGAASAAFHLSSQTSAGLFRAVIAESGTATCPWALQKHPLSWAKKLAVSSQCAIDNSSILVDCLKQKSAKDIVIATKNINGYGLIDLPFVPCVEDSIEGRFLTQDPAISLKEGTFNKVPAIFGTNKDEGIISYLLTKEHYETIDDAFYEVLPELIRNLTKYETNLNDISYEVKAEYFDGIDVTNRSQVLRTAIDFNSDPIFKSPTDFTVKMLAKHHVPVYMYSFEYAGSGSQYNFTGEKEVNHADEVYYTLFTYGDFTKEDTFIFNQLINMWVNFATDLSPKPIGNFIWSPTTFENELAYLKIATNSLTMEKGFLTHRMNFWQKIVPEIVAG